MGDAPILVTGAHRSGTTWTANVLALAKGTALVGREPFNAGPRQWGLGGLVDTDYGYAPALDQTRALGAYRRILTGSVPLLIGRHGRRQWRWLAPWSHPRLIVKDPLAAMSSEWLAQRFGFQVVVVVRHPAAIASSLERVGWAVNLEAFRRQPALLEGPLAPFASDIANPPSSHFAAAGLLWACIYSVLTAYARRNPSWRLVRHRDLAVDPASRFRELFQHLGLTWSAEVDRGLERLTRTGGTERLRGRRVHLLARESAAVATTWRSRLDEGQLREAMLYAGHLAARYYPEDAATTGAKQADG